MYLRLCY